MPMVPLCQLLIFWFYLQVIPYKTTGEGLHIVATIIPKHGWLEVKEFCKKATEAVAREAPER